MDASLDQESLCASEVPKHYSGPVCHSGTSFVKVLNTKVVFNDDRRAVWGSKAEILWNPVLVCKVIETDGPVFLAIENVHDFSFILIERLHEDLFLGYIGLLGILRHPWVEIKLIKELEPLVCSLEVLLCMDHRLQLILHFLAYSDSFFPYGLRLDFILGHLWCLKQSFDINDFARITL